MPCCHRSANVHFDKLPSLRRSVLYVRVHRLVKIYPNRILSGNYRVRRWKHQLYNVSIIELNPFVFLANGLYWNLSPPAGPAKPTVSLHKRVPYYRAITHLQGWRIPKLFQRAKKKRDVQINTYTIIRIVPRPTIYDVYITRNSLIPWLIYLFVVMFRNARVRIPNSISLLLRYTLPLLASSSAVFQ